MANILFMKKFLAKITTIIRTFWWQGVQKHSATKPLHLRSWKDICTPKKEGGLGIRNIEWVNRSMLISTAWRISSNPDSHLASILRAKYHPSATIWTAPIYLPKSVFIHSQNSQHTPKQLHNPAIQW